MKKLATTLFAVATLWSTAHATPTVEVIEETDSYRLIRHAEGETEVPLEPERVVVLLGAEQVVVLGVKPVGVATNCTTIEETFPPYILERLQDSEHVGLWNEPNLEKILALEPDLILSNSLSGELYEQLSRIAPTVLVNEDQDFTGLADYAKVLGRQNEADLILSELDVRVAEAKATVEDHPSVAFIRLLEREISVYGKDLGGYRQGVGYLLHRALALPTPSLVPDGWSESISLEQLPSLDAEHLFVMVEQDDTRLPELAETSLWQALPAVRAGNVHLVTAAEWNGTYDPVGARRFIDKVLAALVDESD